MYYSTPYENIQSDVDDCLSKDVLENYKVKYALSPELLDEFIFTKNGEDGWSRRILKKYKGISVLIILNSLLTPKSDEYPLPFFENIESRIKTSFTICCS